MSLVVLVKGDEVRICTAKDESDARYHFLRRIEKEGFRADKAYMADEKELPIEEWWIEAERAELRREKARIEQEERAQYERLKEKYK
jgi:hypothetical protein